QLDALRPRQVEGDGPLVAVAGQEVGAERAEVGRPPLARLVALAGPLHLDDVGAEVAEHLAAERAGQDARGVQDADVGQGRLAAVGHRLPAFLGGARGPSPDSRGPGILEGGGRRASCPRGERRDPMADREHTLRVYQDLADSFDQQHNASLRDLFLLLAADAALRAGHQAEAELLRQRLLRLNPHHLLKPYASFAEASSYPDIQGYVEELRQKYPAEVAEEMLESVVPHAPAPGPADIP